MLWTELCNIKIHVEVLTPNATVFGERVFRRKLRSNEVIKVETTDGTGILIQVEEAPVTSCAPHRHRGRPCGNTAGRQPSASQEKNYH